MLSHKNSLQHLAARLNYTEDNLLAIINDAPKYYMPFHMVSMKKDGTKKTRHIDNPYKKFPLRALQKKINKELLTAEISELDQALVGGIKKRNMIKHIEPHVGKKTVICMDLSNCFPNISYKRVVAIWKRLGYSSQLAMLLARATTYRGYLPQGAPTSSLLCNFAMSPMARELRDIAAKKDVEYTQYIDDICLSSDDDETVRRMMNDVYLVVPRYEQHINRNKTEIMDSKHQQMFMNVVVNKKTKIAVDAVAKISTRIRAIAEDGIIDSFTNLSIGGQILHVKKLDRKAASHLERIFNNSVKKVYDGGSKPKDATIEPCWDYRKDKTHRAKCHHLSA